MTTKDKLEYLFNKYCTEDFEMSPVARVLATMTRNGVVGLETYDKLRNIYGRVIFETNKLESNHILVIELLYKIDKNG